MNAFTKILLMLGVVVGFMQCAMPNQTKLTQNQQDSTNTIDDAINEDYLNKRLGALIFGVTCGEGDTSEGGKGDKSSDKSDTPKAAHIITPPKNAINASNNGTIEAGNYPDSRMRKIVFNGELLHGGIFHTGQNLYMSADRKFSYALKGGDSNASDTQGKSTAHDSQNAPIKGTLEVRAVCEKQGFTITNFTNGDFGLHLSNNPTKEVAIVLNVNNSMWRYTNALKDIAPYLAKHILGEDSQKSGAEGDTRKEYAKISLITFSYVRIYDLGTFYEPKEFANALNQAKGMDSNDKMVNVALVMAMENFTKDNGLKKEIYLITNGGADDSHKEEQMLAMTKNLNQNIVKNSKENFDNRVKIHTFALKPNLKLLKELSIATGGTYNEASNAYDFKKQILSVSNGGKPFDMRELNNEIRPSKTNKIYDPNNPLKR